MQRPTIVRGAIFLATVVAAWGEGILNPASINKLSCIKLTLLVNFNVIY